MLNLWCDGGHRARENMRRDAALLAAAEDGAAPVLRLFCFDPPGLTLGHAQDPAAELDLEACERDGVEWAVRPTGGRAIFHEHEWTYAFASAADDPEWGGDLAVAYEKVSRLVRDSLADLGVPVAFAGGHRGRLEGDRASAACFASTARHELVVAGRKLAGSAQRRTSRAYLQQGSVLLGPGHLRLAEFLALPDARRAAARDALARSATDAGAWIPPATPLGRWADAIERVRPGVHRENGDAGRRWLTL